MKLFNRMMLLKFIRSIDIRVIDVYLKTCFLISLSDNMVDFILLALYSWKCYS